MRVIDEGVDGLHGLATGGERDGLDALEVRTGDGDLQAGLSGGTLG